MVDTFDVAGARALLDRVRAADGRAPDGPPDADAAEVHARHDPDGTLIALAWRQTSDDAAELYVDPDRRGRGIGRELAETLLRRGAWGQDTADDADDVTTSDDEADGGSTSDDEPAGSPLSRDAGPGSDGGRGEHDDPAAFRETVAWQGTSAHRTQPAEERLSETAARPGIWAHGTLPAAKHLAATLGLTPQRELLQLRAPLAPFRSASEPALFTDGAAEQALDDALPDGVVIRTFTPGADDAEFLRVNAAAFAWHPEQGRLSQAGLDGEKTEPWFDADGFFLAVPAGDPARVLGFHWTKVHPPRPPAEPEALGEIYVLGVDPASPVRHLGGPLTAAGLRHLADKGLRTALLYVEADNERAVRLYRRYGFTDHAADTVFG